MGFLILGWRFDSSQGHKYNLYGGRSSIGRALSCGLSGCRFKSGRSPINMLGFLNTKISFLAGVIVLLAVSGAVGAMIFYQMYQIMNIRYQPMEFKSLDSLEESLE